jgi:hypothetical protein
METTSGDNTGSRGDEGPNLSVLESVRCLECGFVYSKPAGGGTARQNPGCPECGYVGWLSVAIPFTEALVSRRSAADQLQRPHVQPG